VPVVVLPADKVPVVVAASVVLPVTFSVPLTWAFPVVVAAKVVLPVTFSVPFT
jgi:hypothetical protein